MRLVSDVMLSVSHSDTENAERFSEWLAEENGGYLRRLLADWGGPKGPDCWVLGGSLNYGYLEAVAERFGSTAWQYPNDAQLVCQES